mgnify:CR=1 FL=1
MRSYEFAEDYRKNDAIRRADVGIGPYKRIGMSLRIRRGFFNKSTASRRAEQSPAPTTISEVICAFKSIRAKQINAIENTPGRKRWQRSFYDHVVRTEKEYLQIWTYIDNNPLKWELDRFYESE